jgi:hypothetical protein
MARLLLPHVTPPALNLLPDGQGSDGESAPPQGSAYLHSIAHSAWTGKHFRAPPPRTAPVLLIENLSYILV